MTPPSTTTKITCPHCQGQIKSPGLPPGSQVTCPKCGKAFRLAGSGREAEASAEPKRRVQGSGFGVQGSGGGRQPEVGAQKPDVGGQRSEVREQRAEVREQRAEVRDQKAERSEQRGRRESVAPQPAAPAPPPVQPAPQSAPAPAKPMRRPHRGTRGPAAEANEPPAPPAADEPASPTAAGPYAEVVQPPDGFVPLDFDGAAQVTQPSHRPPGVPEIIVPRKVLETVDPMMLAPQAPSRPPPSKEIPVVCTLCGTRMHAAPERIGQTMQCPDCHTINEIKPPKKPPKKRGPTLDGSSDYKLEVAAQRPAYRPVVAPRGEYEELAEFDPAQRPPGWSRPEGSAAAAPTQHAPSTATEEPDSLPEDDYDDEDGEEIRVSAPVERLEIKPEIKPLPPPDPDDYMYDGKYDDGLIGDWADRKKGASWKKAPLMIGIIGFLFYPEALLRVVLYSIGLGAMVNLGWVTAAWAQSDDPSYKVFSMLLTVLTAGGLGVLATSFAAVLYTVVLDTANGNDKIEGWPDWSIFDWIANAIYFPAAAFVAGLPGSVFTIAMLSIGLDPVYGAYAVVAPLMLSWVVLFPLVLYSMLAEGTITAPFSAATVKSLKEASDGWVFFYMYSFVMGLVGGAALAFTGSNYVVFRIMGAAGVVAMMLIYCRVLGRLMWYASEKMAKMERRRAAEE